MDMTFVGDGVAAGPRIVDLYRITHCADGQLVYYVATESQREGLYRAVGHPEWSDDPRFESTAALLDEGNRAGAGRVARGRLRRAAARRGAAAHARGERARRARARARAGVRGPAGAPQRDPAHRGTTRSRAGCASPGTRCASPRRRRRCPSRCPGSASTPTRSLPSSAAPTPTWRRCARPAPSPDPARRQPASSSTKTSYPGVRTRSGSNARLAARSRRHRGPKCRRQSSGDIGNALTG